MAVEDKKPRSCQPCTACCDGWLNTSVQGHVVKPGQPCPHSTGSGCGIFPDRPEKPCRVFFCGWLREDSPLPDWMRPDKCGAIVFLWRDWHGHKVINAVPVGREIPERTLEWLKDFAQKQGRPLMFVERIVEDEKYTGVRYFGFGPAEFCQQVEKLRLHHQQGELLQMYSGLREDVHSER